MEKIAVRVKVRFRPVKRQRKARGATKVKRKRAYRKARAKSKMRARLRYRKVRKMATFKKAQKIRRKFPNRFKRRR